MFDLYVITDRSQASMPIVELVAEVAAVGLKRVAVQLREKDLSPRELVEMGEAILPVCRQYGTQLFINDRMDVALDVGADGVQLTTKSVPSVEARKTAEELTYGVSIHSPNEMQHTKNSQGDFFVLGPIYHTPSKVGMGDPLGLEAIAAAGQWRPVVAVGGIKVDNAAAVVAAGASAIAVISEVIASRTPAKQVQRLLDAIDQGRGCRSV